MPTDNLDWNRAIVLGSALVYWAGVWLQARRVRRRIHRSPNVRPRGPKEKLLWAGWLLVVLAWLTLPFLAGSHSGLPWLGILSPLLHPPSFVLGIVLLTAGYAGTLWCYAAMGDTWRMGIDPAERTRLVTGGPYRFVRHPIYLFQVVMLAGVVALLPTPLSLLTCCLHLACVWTKAADEETFLRAVHGTEYREYLAHTGRLWPKWPGIPPAA